MSKLILFDVDGTLTESGKIIHNSMLNKLITLNNKGYDLGIVGGGKLEKILNQIKKSNCFTHILLIPLIKP